MSKMGFAELNKGAGVEEYYEKSTHSHPMNSLRTSMSMGYYSYLMRYQKLLSMVALGVVILLIWQPF